MKHASASQILVAIESRLNFIYLWEERMEVAAWPCMQPIYQATDN